MTRRKRIAIIVKAMVRYIFRAVEEGERSPRGYGYCWHDYCRNATIACPVPFNIVARAIRWAYITLAFGWRKPAWYERCERTMAGRVYELRARLRLEQAQRIYLERQNALLWKPRALTLELFRYGTAN